MSQKLGRSTFRLDTAVTALSYAAVGGKKEGEGPLGQEFDLTWDDSSLGEKTWEKAESRLQKEAMAKALAKGKFSPKDIDLLFAGDLLNQCVGSTYGLRELDIPFLGIYGACSTMAESLCLASLFVDNGLAGRVGAVTSSHFCSAERQFRFPLEYGGQRPPTAQWTATAAGAVIVGQGEGPFIREVSIGKITDLGVTDANNMGAAMAPAAASTISTFFTDTGTAPKDYDLILTGDLGKVGKELLLELLTDQGINITKEHDDCGLMLYDLKSQDVHAGGSGCGCSASVLCSYVLPRLASGVYKSVLFIATGALMSTTAVQQGESIPGIAHLVHLTNR